MLDHAVRTLAQTLANAGDNARRDRPCLTTSSVAAELAYAGSILLAFANSGGCGGRSCVCRQRCAGRWIWWPGDRCRAMDCSSSLLTPCRSPLTMFRLIDAGVQQSNWRPINVHGNTGRSDFDRPSRFVISGIYNAPYLGFKLPRNAATNAVLGGWQLAWVTVVQSGTPINITDSNGAAYYGTGESLASYAAGATASTAKKSGSAISRLTSFFNTGGFRCCGKPLW